MDTIRLYDLFVAAWAFFGAGLALVLGTGILLAGRATAGPAKPAVPTAARMRNRIFFALCICIAWFLWNQSLAFSGALVRLPGWLWVDVPVVFCIGPLLYLFYLARTGIPADGFRLRRAHALHFVAPVIALVALAPLYALPPGESLEILRKVIEAAGQSPDSHDAFLRHFRTSGFAQTPALYALAFASEASIVVYTLPILWNLRDVFRADRLFAAAGGDQNQVEARIPQLDEDATDGAAVPVSKGFRWLTAVLALGAALLALLGLGALGGIVELARWTVIGLTGMVCFLYVVDRAFDSYFDRLFEAGRRSRYRKSRLAGLDTERVAERLRREMQNGRPYLQDDLTLPELARRLEISPHQLSEFLNDRLGKSFHTMINEYRVAAAREMLAGSDDTVLSIAYAVGFNNRASFNTAFAKFTGTTPVAYRRAAANPESTSDSKRNAPANFRRG